jgi:hypothetical protein
VAHPAPKIPCAKIRWKISRPNFLYQDAILLIDYLPKDHSINAEYCSSLLVQLEEFLKEKQGDIWATAQEKSWKNLSQGNRRALGCSAPYTIHLVHLAIADDGLD